MKENGKGWGEELPTALWAYRIAKSQATGALPFSLVYVRFSEANSEVSRNSKYT